MIRLAASVIAAAALALTACSATEGPCPPQAPNRMPNGSETQSVATSVDRTANVLIWRAGESYVIQRIFLAGAAGEPTCEPGRIAGPTDCLVPDDIVVRSQPAVLAPASEGAQWFMAWAAGECRYETVFGPLSGEDARAYAAGY